MYNFRGKASTISLGFVMAYASIAVFGQSAPSRTADGSKLAALQSTGKEASLLIADGEGASAYVEPKSMGAVSFQWSPNGRQIAFGTNGSESGVGLYVHSVDTRGTQLLATGGKAPLAWREDSKRVAFFHANRQGLVELYQYNLAEKGVSLKVPVVVAPDPWLPMFWLVGTDDVAYVGTDSNVYLIESAEVHKITTTGDVTGFAISSDQKRLLWSRRSPNTRYILVSVYEYDLTGRSVVRLPLSDRFALLNPDPKTLVRDIERVLISPDGSRMALVVNSVAGPAKQLATKSLYVASMDGKSVSRITTMTTGGVARWSAGGKMLFTASGPFVKDSLQEYDPRTGNIRRIGVTHN